MTEQEIIAEMQTMCEQSLPPDVYEKWEEVKHSLERNRQDLKICECSEVLNIYFRDTDLGCGFCGCPIRKPRGTTK